MHVRKKKDKFSQIDSHFINRNALVGIKKLYSISLISHYRRDVTCDEVLSFSHVPKPNFYC